MTFKFTVLYKNKKTKKTKISDGWKTESTLERTSGFEHQTWESSALTIKPLLHCSLYLFTTILGMKFKYRPPRQIQETVKTLFIWQY